MPEKKKSLITFALSISPFSEKRPPTQICMATARISHVYIRCLSTYWSCLIYGRPTRVPTRGFRKRINEQIVFVGHNFM
jgi:hypothetical protein